MKLKFITIQFQRLQRGFSTLEILLAMTILVLTITSVTLTSFGGQSMQIDAETSTEALHEAQNGLEYMQTLARKDFQLVTPSSSLASIGAITYHKTISISTTTYPDYASKEITSTVTWTGENNRPEHVTLSALVTNFDHARGGDTCDSTLSGNWSAPYIVNNTVNELSLLSGTSTGANVVTSVDAYKGKVYVTVNGVQYKTDPRLFIFDINKLKTDPTHALLGKLTTATNTATYGMYAVHVAEGPAGRTYAYVANDYQANWNSCPAYFNCAQIAIVDVTNPAGMVLASTTYFKLPNISGGLTSGGAGNSLYYKDGLLYVGLTKTTSGTEFNIVDVHNPLVPTLIPGSGLNIDFDVSAITVVGNTAYLATNNDSGEVVVVDVSNPASPVLLSTYNAPGQLSAGYGRSLELVGDRLFLGRSSMNSGDEFVVLDASSSLGVIPATPLGSLNIGTSLVPFTVYGTLVRDSLAFLAGGNTSNGKLYIENISNLGAIVDAALPVALPNNSFGFAVDCEGNDIFVGSRDNSASNLGYLSVITATP